MPSRGDGACPVITHFISEHTPAVAGSAAAVSGVSTVTSFFVATLPFLQVIAAIVAIVSGGFAIAVAIKKLREK